MTITTPGTAGLDDARGGPLADVTVVAIEQAVSAPICTRTLADLGARVIKVENPRGGDFARDYDRVVNGLAAHFVWANRGKESISIDIKQGPGLDVLHRLLGKADVLVSNLGPGATTRLGLDKHALEARHPHLISLEISGYGTEGPLAHKRAYDLLVQAESGACATTGTAGQPAKSGPPVVDVCTGLYGSIAILASLHERGRSGEALSSSVAMLDAAAELMSYALSHARYTGVDQVPVGMGSPALAPYGAYVTRDEQVVVLGTTNDREWRRLAAMIGRQELADDPRFVHNPERVAQRDVLDEVVGAWCAGRTLTEVQRLADDAGIGNARYNTPLDVLGHPQLQVRERWREIASPNGPVTALLPPAVVTNRPARMGPIPALGEHTAAILNELGFSDVEVGNLKRAGAIGPP